MTKTNAELAHLLSLSQVSASKKEKQAAKFGKLISDALEHKAADVRFDSRNTHQHVARTE